MARLVIDGRRRQQQPRHPVDLGIAAQRRGADEIGKVTALEYIVDRPAAMQGRYGLHSHAALKSATA